MCLAQQQYKRDNEAKASNASYDSLNDSYKRWTSEDLERTGQLGQINEQVAQRQSEFDQAKQKQLSRINPRSPMLGVIQSQQFNADKMRDDLMRQAALKRVESGVYQRPSITADTPSQQVSVIGGASSRARASTSGGAPGGTGAPRNGPTGVKLNIGS